MTGSSSNSRRTFAESARVTIGVGSDDAKLGSMISKAGRVPEREHLHGPNIKILETEQLVLMTAIYCYCNPGYWPGNKDPWQQACNHSFLTCEFLAPKCGVMALYLSELGVTRLSICQATP